MFTLSVSIAFLSFYIVYNTSKKAAIQSRSGLERYIYNHGGPAKCTSLVLGGTALILHITLFGLTSGLFIFFITLMTIGSFTILLAPLHLIGPKTMALFFIGIFCIEFFAF